MAVDDEVVVVVKLMVIVAGFNDLQHKTHFES